MGVERDTWKVEADLAYPLENSTPIVRPMYEPLGVERPRGSTGFKQRLAGAFLVVSCESIAHAVTASQRSVIDATHDAPPTRVCRSRRQPSLWSPSLRRNACSRRPRVRIPRSAAVRPPVDVTLSSA